MSRTCATMPTMTKYTDVINEIISFRHGKLFGAKLR